MLKLLSDSAEWLRNLAGCALTASTSRDLTRQCTALRFELLEQRSLLALGAPILHIPGQIPATLANGQQLLPPDTVGDVGRHHYIQMINWPGGSRFTVYNKHDGSVALGPIQTSTLATPATPCADDALGDPIVIYDHLADRWLISEFTRPATRNLCLYVSQTDGPTENTWHHYAFNVPVWPDYPKYAVWPDAYYVSANQLNSQSAVYALDRISMLQGLPARPFKRFEMADLSGYLLGQALTPADWDGTTPPPAGAPGYFIRHVDDELHSPQPDPNNDFLELWAFQMDWDNPNNASFDKLADVPIAQYYGDLCGIGDGVCIPQPATTRDLATARNYVMWRLQYRNFVTHETLVGNFTVDMDGNDRAGIRWFELRKTGAGNWTLFQEGTHSPDAVHRWMGSIAMDGHGNIALGYSVSDSATVYPGIRYVGREAADVAGTMQAERTMIDGGGFQSPSARWGDYSAMTIDPVDDKTFWFTTEYVAAGGNPMLPGIVKTRIGTFSFTEPGPRVTAVRIGSTTSMHPDYEISDGSGEQIRTVPVGPANQIEVVFSEDVTVIEGDLTLQSALTGGSYTNVSAFNYDPGSFTATWTFAGAFPADQLVLTIADSVTDASGNELDGEWHNPDALSDTGTDVFPSGNGVAGIDFVFRFTILPGDTDRDNDVDFDDLNNVRNHFGMSPALWTDGDTSGNNAVDIDDLNNVRNHFGINFTSWPSGGAQLAQSGGGTLAAPVEDAFLSALAQLYAVHASDGKGNNLFWDALAEDDFWRRILSFFTDT